MPVNSITIPQIQKKDKKDTIDKINTGLGIANTIFGGYNAAAGKGVETAASSAAPSSYELPELTQESVSRYNQNKYSLGVDLNLFNYKKARP